MSRPAPTQTRTPAWRRLAHGEGGGRRQLSQELPPALHIKFRQHGMQIALW